MKIIWTLVLLLPNFLLSAEVNVPLGAELPHLECGFYKAQGLLNRNNLGQFVLVMRPFTGEPEELILVGGSLSDRASLVGKPVTIEFYVPNEIQGAELPVVYLQAIQSSTKNLRESWLKHVRSNACLEWNRFLDPEDS